jgi:putative glutamine amidotransferase
MAPSGAPREDSAPCALPSPPVRPRIGISRPRRPLDARYADAVAEAGGEPVHLAELGDAEGALAGLAGLVIPGGPDFAPGRPYPPGVTFDLVPDAQLAFERALLAAAQARRLPVLGICYGMQLLAHAAGGSLVFDIATDRPTAAAHRLPEPEGRHAVALEPGTRLAAWFGAREIAVNSSHHQAVDVPGAGLRVAARAPDGIVEAIESSDPARFALGVQWHPERMDPAHRRTLFAALVSSERGRT